MAYARPVTESKPTPNRRGLKFALFVVVVTATILGIKHGRHSVLAKRFMKIEPGLFRSAQMKQWPYERVVRGNGIKTVLRLNKQAAEDDPEFKAETSVIDAHGLKLIWIPMGSGSGLVPFDQLEEAADHANDPSLRPMLFHCAAGDKRSSAVHGVWRMRHCGYTWKQTDAELREFGLRASATRLFAHLERYYNERILGKGEKTDAAVAPLSTNKMLGSWVVGGGFTPARRISRTRPTRCWRHLGRAC
jgi:protein tyrosine phosphatase (PTP) superfamily phosphohydrolase (DUF442 family)